MSEIFLHVFNMSISASYIVLAILLLRLFMKKAPKWISVALWGVVLASLIGNIIGSVVSYFLNKYFTFKNKEKGWKPVLRFALNIAVCYAIAYLLVSPLVSWVSTANHWSLFGWSVEKFAGNLSLAVGACTFVACNYIGQRFFAFREKKETTKE